MEQSFHRVPGTVRDQITLYDPAVTEEQVQTAVRLAGLDEAVGSLEQGLDTPCTPGIFSQGQWQLLSISHRTGADMGRLIPVGPAETA